MNHSMNFTGQMTFLTPNQQCQSTEGTSKCLLIQGKPPTGTHVFLVHQVMHEERVVTHHTSSLTPVPTLVLTNNNSRRTLLARALTCGRASMMNSLCDCALASMINWMYFSSSLLRRPPTPTIGWLERVIVAWLSGCIHDRTYSEWHISTIYTIQCQDKVKQF